VSEYGVRTLKKTLPSSATWVVEASMGEDPEYVHFPRSRALRDAADAASDEETPEDVSHVCECPAALDMQEQEILNFIEEM